MGNVCQSHSGPKVSSPLSSIYIKVRGISIKFNISLDNTVGQLKEKINDTLQMNNESYCLYFQCKIFYTDSNPLNLMNVKNNDVIKLIEKENKEILSILSEFQSYGIDIDIDIPYNIQNTREIKQLISENFFIPLNRVHIFFGGVEIIEDQKIKGLSKKGSFLFSWNKYPNEEDFVNIKVIDCNQNKKFDLNVDLYGNIYEEIKKTVSYDLFYLIYKNKYYNEMFLGRSTENVFYKRTMLKIFSDYHSGKNIILELHKIENIGFPIFVRGLTRDFTLNCQLSEKIVDLKLKILALETIPPEEQRLIYHNKQLEDNKTIAEYNILRESTIYLVLRLMGG